MLSRYFVYRVLFTPLVLSIAHLSGGTAAVAQQAVPSAATAQKSETIEWVYRVQYGHRDEWFQIFKKYQLAILERQKQLGYVKEYAVWSPACTPARTPDGTIESSSPAHHTTRLRANRKKISRGSFLPIRRPFAAKRTGAGS